MLLCKETTEALYSHCKNQVERVLSLQTTLCWSTKKMSEFNSRVRMQHSVFSSLCKLPHFDILQPGVRCGGGTRYKRGKYFDPKSKEITGCRKICQKIPWVANLQEFRLPVMPSIWAGKESIKSLWNVQNGNVTFPSKSTKPHPLSLGRWKVMRRWHILGDMKIWLPLSCAMQCHCCLAQIIEHPCSDCSCVYYWCNWKPSQKEDEKRRKKRARERKQHVLVLAYDTWDILHQNKWTFVWG